MSTFYTGLTSDISRSQLGKPDGFAPLDSNSKIPSIYLPPGLERYTFSTVSNVGTTAVEYEITLIDSTTSTITVNPPNSPQPYSKFAISDVGNNATTNNITIDFTTANQPIFSTVDDYIINEDGGFVEFLYVNSSIGWITIKG